MNDAIDGTAYLQELIDGTQQLVDVPQNSLVDVTPALIELLAALLRGLIGG